MIYDMITTLRCVKQGVPGGESNFANSSEYGYTLCVVNRTENEQEG